MSLRELATRPATVCTPTASVEAAAQLMLEANVGLLCVVDEGALLGVVTDRDLVVRAVAHRRTHDATVAEVMTKHAACISERATPADAARLMGDHQCRRLVVTDDVGAIVGVVSLDDLLRVAGDEFLQIARAVRSAKHAHDVLA